MAELTYFSTFFVVYLSKIYTGKVVYYLKSATPFPKCYLHKEKWTFDS